MVQYPENDILLNNILYVLDYSKNPDETIEIANRLTEKTIQSDVKYDALRFLAYAYKEKGDLESAEKAIEQIPEIYFTKLTEMACLLNGTKKLDAAEKQKWISFEHFLQMIQEIVKFYESIEEYEKAVNEIEIAMQLITVIGNVSFNNYMESFKKQKKRLKEKR